VTVTVARRVVPGGEREFEERAERLVMPRLARLLAAWLYAPPRGS
jgi:antibiotic biosynthesis monooxygenase (ABM) superfamily enzyme